MSEKKQKEIREEQKTKTITARIDVAIANVGERSTYIVITGVPENLPTEYENTVLRTAEGQLAQALNQRLFLEFYSLGKSAKDERPVFINLSKIDDIKVTNIQKV